MRSMFGLSLLALGALVASAQDVPPAPASPPVLTLDEAVAIGIENAFTVRLREADSEQARQRVRQALSAMLPTLTLGGSYTRWDRLTSGGSTGSTGGGDTGTFEIPNDSKQVTASVQQYVDITGTLRKALDAAKLAEQASVQLLQAEMSSVKNDVRSAYLQTLQAEELIAVQRSALVAAQGRLEIARRRFEAGEIANFDVLRLETEVRSAEQQVLVAERNAVLSRQLLNNLLGRPIETEFATAPVEGLPLVEASADELTTNALANRPEAVAAELNVQAREKLTQVEERGNLPMLIISGQHVRVIDPFMGQNDTSTTGSAVISWPVFDGGLTRARVREARQETERARINREQSRLGISLEVRQALTQVVTARQALVVATSARDVAAEALRLAQLRFEEQVGILLDITQAQSDFVAAETNLVNARYAYLVAFAALQRAVGRDDLSTEAP